ncbi:MAG: DUF2196 domain-containing protein [Syntrophobacteraceae bacterium]
MVREVLTSSAFHPHAIKVRLVDGQVGPLFNRQDENPFVHTLQIQGKYNGKGRNSLISLIAIILFSMKTIKNADER